MSAIVISHNSADNAWAQRFATWLLGTGQKRDPALRDEALFLDLDPEHGIPPGRSWRPTLDSKLRLSRAGIVVSSPAYGTSQWCLVELAIAIDRSKLMILRWVPPRRSARRRARILSRNRHCQEQRGGLGGQGAQRRRDPLDGRAWEGQGSSPGRFAHIEQESRLLRGGSWSDEPW
jgi:hypothetical protein